jgi:ubiquitin-conjugating enzyme E2 J2
MAAASPAVRRLKRDLDRLLEQENPQIAVRPSSNSMLEWHFVLHSLPADTVYGGGRYHGKLIFPERYPMAPPALIMVTPSGRLETNQRLCLSMTDFHPESWNPAWSIESILVGVISFMVDETDPKSYGALHEPPEVRRKLAKESVAFNRASAEFRELFPELLADGNVMTAARSSGGKSCKSGKSVTSASSHRSQVAAVADGGRGVIPVCSTPSSPSLPSESGRAMPPKSDEAVVVEELVDSDGAMASPSHRQQTESAADAAANDTPDATADAPVNGPPDATGSTLAAKPEAEEDEEVEECWICREDGSSEPLIQPCLCRGSMSGVHASCVESWIQHRRLNAVTNENPKCAVCGQAYCGSETRPGVSSFAKHVCYDVAQLTFRATVLLSMLTAYWVGSGHAVRSIAIRVLLLGIPACFFFYKSAAVSISLPLGRLHPENQCLRRLFIVEQREVAIHFSELLTAAVTTLFWSIYEQLTWYFPLPILLLALFPLGCQAWRHWISPGSCRVLAIAATMLISPECARGLVDPRAGTSHAIVSLVVGIACFVSPYPSFLVFFFVVHSIVIIMAIVDKAVLKRIDWLEGRSWALFAQTSLLVTYVANLLIDYSKSPLGGEAWYIILGVSLFWFGLACCLSLLVNYDALLEQYHAWQNRNGSFELRNIPNDRQPAPEPQTVGAAQGRHGPEGV